MIDWERIAELQQEVGEEDFAEVLEMFFAEVEESMAALPSASGEDLTASLHFLKGAALNIGMSDFSALCRGAEEALKANGDAQPDVASLRQSLDRSQSELREMMG